MEDKYKFFSGVLSAMSAMVNLEIPWVNLMSKMDLVTAKREDGSGGPRNGLRFRKDIARQVGIPRNGFSEFLFMKHSDTWNPTHYCLSPGKTKRGTSEIRAFMR